MKTVKDVAIYVAEDGERFLSEVEAVTHDSLIYIGKTIAAFGGGQVAEAIKAVELRHPQICGALFHLAKHLQGVQSLLPAGDNTPKIDSVNAPPTVAVNPAPASIAGEPIKEPNGIPAEALQSSSIPDVPPADPDAPETPVNPPSPDLERVTKPDETPREPPHPKDVPSQIYPGGGMTVGQMIDAQNRGLTPDPTDEGVPGSKLEIPPAAA